MSAPSPATVLVADDEPILLALMVRVLEREGYTVLQAQDGREALETLRDAPDIQLVLLDATMPPSGAAGVLRSLAPGVSGPAVMLTSGEVLSPEHDTLLAERQGRFLGKPFAPRELLSAVAALLDGVG